jgi:hypothetical protein
MDPTNTIGPFDAAVVVYIAFWVLTALFSAYGRHARQTAVTVQEKLAAKLPSGVSVNLPPPWFARYGWLENLLVVAGLGLGMALLHWFWVLAGFALFLFALLPAAARVTPHAGAWHYLKPLRRSLQLRLADSEQAGDRMQAEVYRIALERLDKGL